MTKGSFRLGWIGTLAKLLFAPLIAVTTKADALVADAKFVYRQGLSSNAGYNFLAVSAIAWERLSRALFDLKQEALFSRYSTLHPIHYGPSGRGYESVAARGSEERLRRYSEQTSRLEFFIDRFPELVLYNDGDTFLDLGCGTGQNVKMLAARYPSSRIVGYDISADAISLIEECESHPGVVVHTGDLTDGVTRRRAISEGFDHIILSHVFSLIFRPSRAETIALRREILSELVEACGSTLVILDVFGPVGPPTVSIEQRQRAIVSDDVLGYFAGMHGGRAYLVQSDRTRAVVVVKEPQESKRA